MTRRDGVSEAYCPDLRCTPQVGMGKNVEAAQRKEPVARESSDASSLKRSNLSFIGAREGGERPTTGAEESEGDETNRQQR